MMPRSLCRLVAFVAVASTVPFLSGCPDRPPVPRSADYDATVRAFYTGLIAFQVGDDVRADSELTRASKLAPEEPAVWANLGLFRMRQGNMSEATTALEKARTLAPQNSPISLLYGLLMSRQGQFDQAITSFRRAVETDPSNMYAMYALAQIVERQGGATADQEFQRQMEAILIAKPDNLLALLESARVAARGGDAALLKKRLGSVASPSRKWPPEVQAQIKAVQNAASGPAPRTAAIEIVKLKNVLNRQPEYRAASAAIELSDRDVAPPVEQFLKLPPPPAFPAAPDAALTVTPGPASGATSQVIAMRAVPLNEKGATALFVTDGKMLARADGALPGGKAGLSMPGVGGGPLTPDALLPIDVNSDYRTDLALAGPGGFRLLRQSASGTFEDVTTKAKLPAIVINGAYNGAWAADIEADGDLDIVLGGRTGGPVVLRNNGDGSFITLTPFSGIASGLRGWAWADVRGDGVADAALLDGAGRLHVFQNERSGLFRERAVPDNLGKVLAITVSDADRDGLLDFVVWDSSGQVTALCDTDEGGDWRTIPLFKTTLEGVNTRLLAADVDANGGGDFVVSAGGKSEIWLSDAKNVLSLLPLTLDFAAQDVTLPEPGGTALALIGIANGNKPVIAPVKGTKNYGVQVLRPRAAENAGDQRINSFGVGGEVEVRAGLLYQKLPINGPWVRFGLGTQTGADYSRILWPNGSVQGEFDLKADQPLLVQQRLKGSCPFLFAWDGKKMSFVTDCIWRSPLGLRINAQDTAGVAMTEDRVKLRSDQLVPRDGFYDLTVTADLWETHYFDHLSLMTVDHPEGTEIYVDERFAIPPPPLDVHAFAPTVPIASAQDDRGMDVTEIVRERDGRSVDTFGRGRFQGVTRDHYLEIDLGKKTPGPGKPLYLIANGWIHPTDSSINVALAQGDNGKPSGLSLEVPDGRGGWRAAKPALGFPSGKVKTVLIRIDDVLSPGPDHRIRLRTNLEIYWDQIMWAERLPKVPLRMQKIAASTANLEYRGFAVVRAKDASSPELPVDFDTLQGTAPLWRDLIGYHTRFGDVRPLIAGVDDRYVIMNAGDALRLRYAVPPPPPAGWKRDFVMVSDGWEKDGDYNTAFSKTVLPLPSHADTTYTRSPARLEDDPMYQRYPADWQNYHTRYVTPREFVYALRPKRD